MRHSRNEGLRDGSRRFIGHQLKDGNEGYEVIAVDLKEPEFEATDADKFIKGDLRNIETVYNAVEVQQVYQLAADTGGAGYIFTGKMTSKLCTIVHK